MERAVMCHTQTGVVGGDAADTCLTLFVCALITTRTSKDPICGQKL